MNVYGDQYGLGDMYGCNIPMYNGNTIPMGSDMMNYPANMNQMCENMQGMYQMNTKPIKYTKSQIIQGLKDNLVMLSGVAISCEEKIEEIPDVLRHACSQYGVSFLQKCAFPVPEMGLSVDFYFCKACGKLYYLKDFMMGY